jgi:peptide/nickel transport system ATP-binding protein
VPVLEIDRLRAGYRARSSAVVAADDVTFSIERGATVALVGESGSGKTTIARCIVGLHEPWSGQVRLDGVPLSPLAKDRSAEARKGIQIVFQNPYDSLNPKHRVGAAVAWPARLLRGVSRAAADAEALALLERVRLPQSVARRFPTELSGGERQRVAIARALAAQPRVLVCDEITSALDVSVQAAALELLAELRTEFGLSILLVSHDLGVVASVADRVLILNEGVICEEGPTMAVLSKPTEDYTRAIIDSTPRLATHVTP